MEHLTDRLSLFIIGCVLGFAFGYLTRSLREIKEELDEVDEILKKRQEEDLIKKAKRKKNENGFTRYPLVADIALLLVIAVTVWAAVESQRASNDVKEQQDKLEKVVSCVQRVTADTVDTLNKVTEPSRLQASNNVRLQKAQAKFVKTILGPPPASDKEGTRAFKEYYDALGVYVASGNKYKERADQNPYPKTGAINTCLERSK